MRISDWSSDVCSSDLEDVIEDSDVRQAAVPCAILEDRSGWSADTVHNHMRRVLRSHPPAFGNGQGIAGCERSHDGGKGRLAAAVLSVDGRHTRQWQSGGSIDGVELPYIAKEL